MDHRTPKQNPTPRIADNIRFIRVVKRYMSERNWTQKDLASACDLSESMVSRMFKNDNGHGDTFDLQPYMVMKITCGLAIGWDGYRELMEAAFPEFMETLDAHQPATMMNGLLEERGKPRM